MKDLSSNKNIVIRKADNDNSVVLVNRANYVQRMKELLWDVSTKDISQQNSKLFMASLDVNSLFTNVPHDETIDICVKEYLR